MRAEDKLVEVLKYHLDGLSNLRKRMDKNLSMADKWISDMYHTIELNDMDDDTKLLMFNKLKRKLEYRRTIKSCSTIFNRTGLDKNGFKSASSKLDKAKKDALKNLDKFKIEAGKSFERIKNE